jgi:hypothetical protein
METPHEATGKTLPELLREYADELLTEKRRGVVLRKVREVLAATEAESKATPREKRAAREAARLTVGAITVTEARLEIGAITETKARLENREKPPYKPDMDSLNNYLKSLGVAESRQPELAAKIDAFAKAEITGREAAPQLSEADLAAFMTPQQIAAVTADTPLGRLQVRYEKRLQEIVLPEDKIKDVKQARAAGLLGATFRNLVKQQIKAGLTPQPQDERVTKAQRLSVAFYREQKAGHGPPRRRGRPSSKVAMNALA